MFWGSGSQSSHNPKTSRLYRPLKLPQSSQEVYDFRLHCPIWQISMKGLFLLKSSLIGAYARQFIGHTAPTYSRRQAPNYNTALRRQSTSTKRRNSRTRIIRGKRLPQSAFKTRRVAHRPVLHVSNLVTREYKLDSACASKHAAAGVQTRVVACIVCVYMCVIFLSSTVDLISGERSNRSGADSATALEEFVVAS